MESIVQVCGISQGKQEQDQAHFQKAKGIENYGKCDSNYAANKSDRRSVSGCIMTVGGGCITNWFSQTQRSVTLSSTEAEYCAFGNWNSGSSVSSNAIARDYRSEIASDTFGR